VGYAFSGSVEQGPLHDPELATRGAAVWLVRGKMRIALEVGESIIGRDPGAAVWVDDSSVSRRHARISVSAGGATLEDLGSKNGTFLKEEPVSTPRALADGDRFRIGTVEMVLRCYRGGVSTESVRSR